jgi:hypothetical protein
MKKMFQCLSLSAKKKEDNEGLNFTFWVSKQINFIILRNCMLTEASEMYGIEISL